VVGEFDEGCHTTLDRARVEDFGRD